MRPSKGLLSIALLAIACGLPSNAARADDSGFYLNLTDPASAMLLRSNNIVSSTALGPSYSTQVEGGFGYKFPALPIRLEGDVMYRSNHLHKVLGISGTARSSGPAAILDFDYLPDVVAARLLFTF